MDIQVTQLAPSVFVALIDGKVRQFESKEAADQAVSAFLNGAEHTALAEKYCEANGIEGKNAKAKINVITDFLAWVDAGTPQEVADPQADVEDVPFETEEAEPVKDILDF